MSERSAIEWTDSTFNPWIGCTKISPGCDHCYAEAMMDTRRHVAKWGAGMPRKRTSPANWAQPLRWERAARFFRECSCGWRGVVPADNLCPSCRRMEPYTPARRRVFCASLADVFDNEVDPLWRADLFWLIAATPNLDWLLLTKRIGNAESMMAATLVDPGEYLDRLWLGATCVNQAELDRDYPKLVATPAAKHFLSLEPLLGPIDFAAWPTYGENGERLLDWVIAGGESGPHARPMHQDWPRGLRDQCAAAAVPFLFKQWGEWAPDAGSAGGAALMCWTDSDSRRVGKKAAGRTLDGREHSEFPI